MLSNSLSILLAMWELLQLLALMLMEIVGLPISLVDRMVVVNVSKSLDESSIAVALTRSNPLSPPPP
jgi:hypothetical protein